MNNQLATPFGAKTYDAFDVANGVLYREDLLTVIVADSSKAGFHSTSFRFVCRRAPAPPAGSLQTNAPAID